MPRFTKEEVAEIRKYVERYIDKTKKATTNKKLASIWDFADFIEFPVKMKKIPYLSGPVEIQWETTPLCNHRCYFCYFKNMLDRKDYILNTEEIKKMIDDAADIEVIDITIEGGEPFMRRDILEILRYIRDSTKISIDLLSNCSLVTKEIVEELSSIFDLKRDGIQVSLVAHNAENHMHITGMNTFDRVVENSTRIVEEGISLRNNTVINKYNYNHLHDVYKLAVKIGVNSGFSVVPPFQYDNTMYTNESYMIESVKSLNKALDLEEEFKIPEIVGLIPIHFIPKIKEIAEDILEPGVGYKNYTGCYAMSTKMNVNYNGDVYPCIFLQYPEFRMGNIRERNIKDIWKYPEKDSSIFRDDRMISPHKCGNCEISGICAGGCWGATYYKFHNFYNPDPRCRWCGNSD